MFGPKKILTESEKIEYIYKKLRSKARTDTIMMIIKLSFFGFLIYFYIFMVPKIDIAWLIDKYAIPYMSKIVQMTAEKTMQGVWNNMWNIDMNSLTKILNNTNTTTWTVWAQRRRNVPNTTSTINWVNVTPEMIDAAKQLLNNK